MTFSDQPAVRVAIRIEGDDFVAYPFDADDIPTESDMAVAKVGSMSVERLFDHVRFVYQVSEIAG